MSNATAKPRSSLQERIRSLLCTLLFSVGVASVSSAFALTGYVAQTQPVGYVGQERTSSATLASGNETLYRSDYQKTNWAGNVYAYPISSEAVINLGAERWGGNGASAIIDAQSFNTGRNIATMKDDGTAVPFLSGSLSAAQVTSLTSAPFTGTQIIDFLRGDRSNEGATTLRVRGTVLGDIIHSRPLYIPDATDPTVLVGANDGMLHAINATDGSERWAYVPSMLLSKMKNLAANPYVHDYYVDGQFTIGTVNISGNKRVLVGGLGSGGKGLYALDITNLTAATDSNVASKVLWEITPSTLNYATPQIYPSTTSATAYQNLGYTHGIPQMVKINNGGTLQDAVIVGNGINTCGTAGGTSPAGCDYQAYLFVIDAATGKLIRAILADTASTTNGTVSNPNGLSSPLTIDTDGDGGVDRVYAGDLNGTMWKFDLSSTTPSAWGVSALYTTSPAQPITASPDATTHPLGGFMVTFATGSELTGTYGTYDPATATWTTASTGEIADTSVNAIYGIWDGAPVANTTLVTQILQERDYIYPPPPATGGVTTKVRRIKATAPNWASGGNKGWKLPLQICGLTGQPTCAGLGITAGGERVIGEGSFTYSGRYYVTVHNPNVPYLVPNTTTVLMGENWQLSLYFENGGSHELFMDLNASGVVGNEDRIQYIASDTNVLNSTNFVGDAIITPNEDGIAVGKRLERGVASQPVLVKLSNLYTTLFSENPDITIPTVPDVEQGVTGGHFDTDIFYGSSSGGTKATATITVGTTGQTTGFPATLGAIAIDGTPIAGALTTALLTDGTATTTNANAIKIAINNLTASGYTSVVSGSVITVSAPFTGDAYNNKTFTVTHGNSQTLVAAAPAKAAVKASRSFTFNNAANVSLTGLSIKLNGTEILTPAAATTGSKSAAGLATWVATATNLTAAFKANYTIAASGSTATITAITAAPLTDDINTLTVDANSVSASTITSAPTYVNGVTAVTGVVGINATGSVSFNYAGNANPTGFSLKVNGTEILTSSAPGSLSASGLAAWVATTANTTAGFRTNYTVTASGSTVTITAKTAVATTWNISSIAVSETPPTASSYTTVNAATAGITPVVVTRPTGLITFAGGTTNAILIGTINRTLTGSKTITVGTTTASNANPLTIGIGKTPSQAASAVVTSIGTGGTIKAYIGSNTITPTCASATTSVVCLVDTSTYTNGLAVTLGTTSNFNGSTPLTVSTTATANGAATAVAGVSASRSFTFTNAANISPTGFSIKVNGTEILTSTAPGSQSSSGLAAWVATTANTTAGFRTNYTVTASGSTVTLTAKTAVASTWDISSIVVTSAALPATVTISTPTYGSGVTPVTAVTGVNAAGSFAFNNSFSLNPTAFSVTVNGTNIMNTGVTTPGSDMSASQLAAWVASNASLAGYAITNSGSTVNIQSTTNPGTNISSIVVAGNVPALPTSTIGTATLGANATAAVTQSGWTDFFPAVTGGTFSGGVNSVVSGNACTTCSEKTHVHQYDDTYDVTGLNMLNASDSKNNLSMAIPSTGSKFKVLMHNQYLSPAAKLHIGNPSYLYNVNFGYISVKDYQTTATLDLATVPTYSRSNVGSLAINLPTDALTSKNWWGNGDVRTGLHPTQPGCVKNSGTNDGNMFSPVIPPANGVAGNGTNGWSTSTTPATATGVRHNGALVVQIIKDTTPNADIELNVAGRPEYGWRVKSAKYSTDVLAEYAMYWHYGPCYGDPSTTQSFQFQFNYNNSLDLSNFSFLVDGVELLNNNNPPSSSASALVTWIMAHRNTLPGITVTSSGDTVTIHRSDNVLPDINVTGTGLTKGDSKHSYTLWTKTPPVDKSGCDPLGTNNYCKAPATGATDPHVGDLGGLSGNVTYSVTNTVANVTTTTIFYSGVTNMVTNTVGNVTTTTFTYSNGTTATIVQTVNMDGTSTVVTTDALGNVTTQIILNSSGGGSYAGTLMGSHASIVTTVNADQSMTIVTTDALGNVTTQIIAKTAGGSGTSGLLSGSTSGVGRVSWRELIKK